MPDFNASNAELHLGILQNRAERTRGKMNAAMLRVGMIGKDSLGVDLKDKDYSEDRELAELEVRALDQAHQKAEDTIAAYEDLVINLTKL